MMGRFYPTSVRLVFKAFNPFSSNRVTCDGTIQIHVPAKRRKILGKFLANRTSGLTTVTLFERNGLRPVSRKQSNAGNAVRIGDGCATVSDYNLPKATVSSAFEQAGRRE